MGTKKLGRKFFWGGGAGKGVAPGCPGSTPVDGMLDLGGVCDMICSHLHQINGYLLRCASARRNKCS